MAATLSQYNHPSLGLGDIAQPQVIGLLDQINVCESKVEAAHDKLETAIAFKRSLAMTTNELAAIGVDTSVIDEKAEKVDALISTAATEYIGVKIENEEAISKLKTELSDIPHVIMPESPINYEESKFLALPLFSESMKLDSRFFSFNGNLQADKLADVEKFIRTSTSNIGSKSIQMSQMACDQISNQVENHNICGTLIITVSCTHRNARQFVPLIIDPDKAINAWNSIQPDRIDLSNPVALTQALSEKGEDSIPLITGAVYGSSFIGMIHILQFQENTFGNLDKLRAQLEKKLRAGGWLANATGEIGVDPAIAGEIRSFLSTNSISSHVSIVSMGTIPTIKAGNLALSADRLAVIEPEQMPLPKEDMGKNTASSEAETARQNALANTVRNARIRSILGAVSKADDDKNSCLDMQTLIDALSNYIEIISKKDSSAMGIPISFFVRQLTKADIVKLWLAKYYPKPSEDDA